MPVETIRTPPKVDEDFTSLEEYQSHTPDSFFGGKPVLHFYTAGAQLILMSSDGGVSLPIFRNGAAEQTVDVFVNSE
jgi:chloride channel, nucleotide-sensitive, 1A